MLLSFDITVMCSQNDREALAGRLKGQKLVIPDMKPMFAHWPGGLNENYQVVKKIIEKELRPYVNKYHPTLNP